MPGLFSSATLEQIRAASDIVDVIGSYLPLKHAGANFVALCPFHKEKTPSFNVNPQRQIFHCFGCHKGGDVFTFVKEYENIGFPEAVKRLADRARIPLEYEQGPAGQQSRHVKDALLQIHEQITQRWQSALANEAGGQVARDYLAKRGVPAEAVRLFRLGYAPDVWDDTVNWARGKGHELALVEKAGLIIQRPEVSGQIAETDARSPASAPRKYYDRFRGRLMFPICDEQGRVIGFSGRILADDEKTAKYVNSPETPIFTKSRVFFGLDKSKRALLDAGFAVVCEGQLDLIACFMAGVQNVVAPQGTAFTADHARILKRYVEEVVLCFDSDEAGQNAAVRSLDHLLASGLAVRVAIVPAPDDPDSFIKGKGAEAFQRLIEQAEGFFDYYLRRLCAANDAAGDRGRLAILRGMADAVHKTGNGVLVDKYAQKTALRLGVSSDAVRAEFKKARRSHTPDVSAIGEAAVLPSETLRPSPQEYWLLKLILLHQEFLEWISGHLDTNWIQHALVREIVSRRIEAWRQQTWQNLGTFIDECERPEMQSLITETAAENRPIPNPAQQLADVLFRLRNQYIDRELHTLIQRANQPETDEVTRVELLRRQKEVREMKRRPMPLPT